MLNKLYNRIEKLSAEKPVLTAFLVFLGAALIVVPASLPFFFQYPEEFVVNVMSETYGTLFDMLIIGWLLLWLNKLADRRQRKIRYREEIEDVLGWQSPEAAHRIATNIRRLNREGVTTDINLVEAHLKSANLEQARLANSDMWGVNLQQATLRKVDLSQANLAGANFKRADVEQASFRGADLRGANLMEADLERADLEEANLSGADLTGADLQYTTLKNAVIERATLHGTNLRGADLEHLNLRGADFDDANLLDASLRQADLAGADLRDAYLERADLRGADLSGASLERTELLNAEFDDIDLFAEVDTLHEVQFDPDVEDALRSSYPHLFGDEEEEKAAAEEPEAAPSEDDGNEDTYTEDEAEAAYRTLSERTS
ncbi:MAG: hypothetical protein BRD45_05310 [Bacteroidetes bacterium QS_8_64_10]|nr:MAG: hypothetical protein BRD45_05310 [Bacteroidetes bacterium QS_8_64_10]